MARSRSSAVILVVALAAAGCAYVVAEAEPAPSPAPASDAAAEADAPPPPPDAGKGDALVDATAEADAPPPMKRVFVTQAAFAGDFGGLAAADAYCNAEAATAGLGGPFAAWLSTDDVDANGRFQPGTYYSPGSKSPSRVISLPAIGQNLDGPIGFTASGEAVDSFAWTGTLASGIRSGQSCAGWTTRGGVGTTGRTGRVTGAWTNNGAAPCSETKRLYCFER